MDCPELVRRRQVKIPINQQDKARDEILLSSSQDVLHGAAGLPSCICFAKYFSRLWGADDTQIETSICAAVKTAKGQKVVSLQRRAEGKPGLRNLGSREKSAVNLRDF